MTQNILTLSENTKGRDFVVGDLHGAFDLLDRALAAANFDPEKDRVISLGDLIDRGPQSARCLDFLAKPWFFALRGNHEERFLELFDNGAPHQNITGIDIQNGLDWVLCEDSRTLEKIRAAIEKLPIVIETRTTRGSVGFVHADVPEGMDWDTFKLKIEEGDEKTTDQALWSRKRIKASDDDGVAGIDRVFFGHTPQDGPRRLGNCFYVDTGAVFRLLFGDEAGDCSLTFCDIAAKTESMTPKEGTVNVITDTPLPAKPFSRYMKFLRGPK